MIDATIKGYATRSAGALLLAALAAFPFAWSDGSRARIAMFVPADTLGTAHVIDGDTIRIGDIRIRLEGIDAPEVSQRCGRAWFGTWACGRAAANELARMLAGQQVRCQSRGVDAYGRMLGHCFVESIDVNAEMVRRGLAWAFIRYSTVYAGLEADARAQKLGVWQGESQPPWEYRHARWLRSAEGAPAGCAIKGNVTRNGRIYHMPWSPWYDQITIDPAKGKRWFCSEREALASGWRAAHIR